MFSLIALLIQKTGVAGIAALMVLENIVPFLPSELVMPIAGIESAKGAFSPFGVILCATAGSVLGGSLSYWVGRQLGLERLKRLTMLSGRWVPLSASDLSKGKRWFDHWAPRLSA